MNIIKPNIILIALVLMAFHTHANVKAIAITKMIKHVSLDQARQGILDELAEQGYSIGKNLHVIDEDGDGGITTARTMAKMLVDSTNVDMIIPISTISAQTIWHASLASQNSNIPIVFSSVTDPISAGLVANFYDINPKITGTTDFPPLKELVELMRVLLPNIKTIGILYNPREPNSVKVVQAFKEIVGNDLRIMETVATSSRLVTEAVDFLVGKVDAIYVPSDNTSFAAMRKLVHVTRVNKIPLFTNDSEAVKQGALACYGYTQYDVGRATGKLVAQYLNGDKALIEKGFKIIKPEKASVYINKTTAEALNLAIPQFDFDVNIVK